jgi:predicted amidohydrolase
MQICYDHFFPEVTRSLALNGAEIIFTPIMGDIRTHEQAYEAVARARALDNTIYYVTSIRDTARSLIVDPSGTILADSKGVPGVVFADIDLDAPFYEPWLSVEGSAEFRHLWRKERRPGSYGLLTRNEP